MTATLEQFTDMLESPVKRAVVALIGNGEHTESSGFHHHLNRRWGIVFKGYASELVLEAARRSGLDVSYRGHVRWRYEVYTDVWLDDCREDEPEKAREVFDRFANVYNELVAVVIENTRDREEMNRRAERRLSDSQSALTSP